jgi:hypothetical protein
MNLSGTGRARQSGTEGDELFWGGAEAAHFFRALPRVHASLTLGTDSLDEVGKAKSFSVNLGSDTVEVVLDQTGVRSIIVNSEIVSLTSNRRWLLRAGKIFPIPLVVKEEPFDDEQGTRRTYLTHDLRPFSDNLVDALTHFFHGNTSRETIAEFASTLLYAGENQFFEQLKERGSISSTFQANISVAGPKTEWVEKIRRAVLLSSLSGIIQRIDTELVDFATSVKYVEPIRATAERYYRHQDLAVDEIDSRGENAAMFLDSLQPWEADQLKTWMLQHLGFYASVEKGSGHVQVQITSRDGAPQNIADLGFGYSQLLPVILQVWKSLAQSHYVLLLKSDARPVLAIEQPELHLHPQFQAQIADVLAAVLSESRTRGGTRGLSPAVFLETHSEHIVNRLGQLIGKGRLKSSDVQILVVADGEEGISSVKNVTFDENGFLGDEWPVGFFVPEIA